MTEHKKGRPAVYQDNPMSIYSVRLSAWHARKARMLAQGNMGDGIRTAIERAVAELEGFDAVIKKDCKDQK